MCAAHAALPESRTFFVADVFSLGSNMASDRKFWRNIARDEQRSICTRMLAENQRTLHTL
jgi:hypothetical protein